MTIQEENLIRDLDAFRDAYSEASFWKRNFAGSGFTKEFNGLLEKHQAQGEMALRALAAAGRIGVWKDPRGYPTFLENFMDKGLVRVFAFLHLVLDEQQHPTDCYGPIDSVFQTLSERNRVSDSQNTGKPIWPRPGIPCLLEALIQLISGEKTKYKVYNNRWHNNYMCWQAAAENSIGLAGLAVGDLKNDALYAGIEVAGVDAFIRQRANSLYAISDEEAKKLPNYREIDGDPSGGFKPMPGHCQVFLSAASKQVNFVEELRPVVKESGAAEIFRRYVGV